MYGFAKHLAAAAWGVGVAWGVWVYEKGAALVAVPFYEVFFVFIYTYRFALSYHVAVLSPTRRG